MLSEIIEKIAAFEPKVPEFYPRPSLAGPEQCLRKLVYMATGVPPQKPSDRLYLVLDDSSWHEELTLDWLRKSAFQVHSEQLEVNCGTVIWMGKPFTIKGHIDAIVTDLTGKDYLLEHKAINHFSFQKYLEKDYPMDYLTQCTLYLVGLQKLNPDINEGVLLIKNKNTSQYLEFNLLYNSLSDLLVIKEVCSSNGFRRDGVEFKGLYKNAIDRFNQVEQYRAKNELPSRQYSLDDWQCSYCPYSEICYEGYEKEINSLKTVELPQDYLDMLFEYEALVEQKKVAEERIEEIKEKLKMYLKEKNAKTGKVEEFAVCINLQFRKQINKEKIPKEILAKAFEEKMYEILTIKKNNKK